MLTIPPEIPPLEKKTRCAGTTRHAVPDRIGTQAAEQERVKERCTVYVDMCHCCSTLCHMEGSVAPAFVLDGK